MPAGEEIEGWGWGLLGGSLPTGTPEFDARYAVRGDDARWALLVLNPAMLVRLIDHSPLTVVVAGDTLAVISSGWVPAAELTGFQRFAEQVALSARSARS